MHLGELVKVYRKKNKITQSEFADMSGLSRQTVTRIELNDDEQNLSVNEKTLVGISKAMGLSYKQLISTIHGDQPDGNVSIDSEEVIPIMDITYKKKIKWVYISGYTDCFGFYPNYPDVSKIYFVQKNIELKNGNHIAVLHNGKLKSAYYFNIRNNVYYISVDNVELTGNIEALGKIVATLHLESE